MLQNLGIAVCIGALVGVERERKSNDLQFGGLRTFMIIALFGALAAWLDALRDGYAITVLGGAAVAVLLSIAYFGALQRKENVPGVTTEIAGLAVYALGAGTVAGYPQITVPVAIVLTGILAFKRPMHRIVDQIGKQDIAAVLQLLVATFIVLPLLPDEPVDPWGAINPYKLWWLVIFISALGLVGYIAVRWLGQNRGMAVTGLFGGLVSSTAVTLSFARRGRENVLPDPIAAGILLAWAVMFVRVIVEVAVVSLSLLPMVLGPMVAMGLVSAALVGWFMFQGYRKEKSEAEEEQEEVKFSNPFRIVAAIQFGALFAVVLLVVEICRTYVSEEWLYLVAVIAGTTDVDAIALSLAASHAEGDVTAGVAVGGIVAAALSNTVVKAGMVVAIAKAPLRWRIAAATAAILVAGGAAIAVAELTL